MRQPPPQLQLVQHFWVGRVVRNDEAGSLLINSDALDLDDAVFGLQSKWWVMRRSRIRTYIKKVEAAIEEGNRDAANAALKEAQPEMMRGVSRGVYKKNTAARKISRLSHRINKIQ